MNIINLSPVEQLHVDIYGEKVAKIQELTGLFYGIPVEVMLSKDQHYKVIRARQMAQYLCRDIFGMGLPFAIIGYLFMRDGQSVDHNTVRHNYNLIGSMLREKTAFGRYVNNDLRNEHQVIRGNVIFSLTQMDSTFDPHDITNKKGVTHSVLGIKLFNRLVEHCKSTGITRSMFIRNAIVKELNLIQNGTQV